MAEWPDLGGRFEGKTHILPVRVYYEDTDFSGVVYHGNYVRYFERGRSDCLRVAGINHLDLWEREEPIAFTIQRMELEFSAPARVDDVLEVHTCYTRAGGARIEAAQAIYRGTDVLVRARVTAACINGEGRPRRLPAEVIEALRQHLADDAP